MCLILPSSPLLRSAPRSPHASPNTQRSSCLRYRVHLADIRDGQFEVRVRGGIVGVSGYMDVMVKVRDKSPLWILQPNTAIFATPHLSLEPILRRVTAFICTDFFSKCMRACACTTKAVTSTCTAQKLVRALGIVQCGKMQHDSQCSIGRPIYVVCIETGDRMDRRQQKLMDLALSCGRKLVKNPRFYAVIVFTRWCQSRRGLFYFLSFVEINETGMIR